MNDIVVLIPHYNNIEGLKRSIASIKENVDILVIDDGSSEKPRLEELINCQQNPKVKIEILYLDTNQGIEHALNSGLNLILQKPYKYIARLDAGDICAPNRFSIQKQYLEQNSDVYLVGSWAKVIYENSGEQYILKRPIDWESIRKGMFINNMFVHPTVMFRKELIEEIGIYPTNYKYAEDYAYFFKIVQRYKCENIPYPLVEYYINSNSISLRFYRTQLKSRIKIIWNHREPNVYFIYGLCRNVLLLLFPKILIEKLKKMFHKFIVNKNLN